jgi:mRNA interferase RelE/StbE
LVWTIDYSDTAKQQLRKLDRQTARRIIDYVDEHLATLENPRDLGKPLTGPLGTFWRYRLGDYLTIAEKTPSFEKGMIGDSTRGFLLVDILPDDGDWRSPARASKIAGRPKHAFQVPLFEFRESSSQVPGRYPLEAVYELGNRHFGGIVHQEMDMVFLAIEFH